MKNLVVAVIMIVGLSSMAQDREMKGKRGGMNDLSPEQVATLQTKKMTLTLDLNESQQTKMKSILLEDAKTRKAKMEEHKARKDEDKALTPDERFAMQNERLDHQLKRKQEMKSLLTEDQYVKWEKGNMKRGMHRKGREHQGKERSSRKG